MIIGIDEVGRGCWAGPLVAAAVELKESASINGLTDSKKLTASRRETLIQQIQQESNQIGIGWVWPKEINTLGLTESVRLSMKRAIQDLNFSGRHIIIDGNINYLHKIFKLYKDTPCFREYPCKVEAVVKADGSVPAVSAASIIAKVARDTYMRKIAAEYPSYGFERHVGYGTKAHREALNIHGVLPIHRIKYKPIQAFLASSSCRGAV